MRPCEVVLGSGRTVLLFLTSSCYGCRPLWDSLEDGERPVDDARLVLVTPSPSTESARDVAALAPDGTEVLMSSEAWHAFGVTAAPWFVVVAGGFVGPRVPRPPPGTRCEPGSVQHRPSGQRRPASRPSTACTMSAKTLSMDCSPLMSTTRPRSA